MDLTVEKFKIGGVPINVADKQCRENVVSILHTINSLQGSINEIETKIESLPTIYEAIQKDIVTLKSEVSTLQTQISGLSENINNVENSISNLETTKADNSDFNTQYTAITGTLIDGYVCNRKGNISLELCDMALKSALPANSWTAILSIPSEYRPILQIYRTVTFAGKYPVILRLQKNGTVKAYTTTTLDAGVICYDGVEFI